MADAPCFTTYILTCSSPLHFISVHTPSGLFCRRLCSGEERLPRLGFSPLVLCFKCPALFFFFGRNVTRLVCAIPLNWWRILRIEICKNWEGIWSGPVLKVFFKKLFSIPLPRKKDLEFRFFYIYFAWKRLLKKDFVPPTWTPVQVHERQFPEFHSQQKHCWELSDLEPGAGKAVLHWPCFSPSSRRAPQRFPTRRLRWPRCCSWSGPSSSLLVRSSLPVTLATG